MPVEPGRMSSPAALMKMWSISVEPMPSMILRPVARSQASKVGLGRVSPAETHFLRLARSKSWAMPAMAR